MVKLSMPIVRRLGIAVVCASLPLWTGIARAQAISDNLTIMQGATTVANINIPEAAPGAEASALWATVTAVQSTCDASSAAMTTCWGAMAASPSFAIVALTNAAQPGGGITDATIGGNLVSDFVGAAANFTISGVTVDAVLLVSDGSSFYNTVANAYSGTNGATLLAHTVFLPETGLQQNLTSPLLYTSTGFSVLVTSVEPVPEPDTFALCAAGLAAVGWIARRTRRRR